MPSQVYNKIKSVKQPMDIESIPPSMPPSLPPSIINLHEDKKSLKEYGTLYIGRSFKNPNHFGNPFSHIKSAENSIQLGSRGEAIEEFEKWIIGTEHKHLEQDRRHWILKHLWKIKQAKKLACFCAPKPCHGQILKKLALQPHTHIH
jgi:hypothetical protein